MTHEQLTNVNIFIDKITNGHCNDYFNESNTAGLTTSTLNVHISPEFCGMLAPMFKSIELTISLTYYDNVSKSKNPNGEAFVLSLNYQYEHPSGRNGYEVSYVSYDDCKTFNQR